MLPKQLLRNLLRLFLPNRLKHLLLLQLSRIKKILRKLQATMIRQSHLQLRTKSFPLKTLHNRLKLKKLLKKRNKWSLSQKNRKLLLMPGSRKWLMRLFRQWVTRVIYEIDDILFINIT